MKNIKLYGVLSLAIVALSSGNMWASAHAVSEVVMTFLDNSANVEKLATDLIKYKRITTVQDVETLDQKGSLIQTFIRQQDKSLQNHTFSDSDRNSIFKALRPVLFAKIVKFQADQSVSDGNAPLSARRRIDELNKKIADEQAAAQARTRRVVSRDQLPVPAIGAIDEQVVRNDGVTAVKLVDVLDVIRRNVATFQEYEEQMQRNMQFEEGRELTPEEELARARHEAVIGNDLFRKMFCGLRLTQQNQDEILVELKNTYRRAPVKVSKDFDLLKQINFNTVKFETLKDVVVFFGIPDYFDRLFAVFNAQDKKQFISNFQFFRDTLEKVIKSSSTKVADLVEVLKAVVASSKAQAGFANINSPLSSGQVSPRDRSPRRGADADVMLSKMIDVLFIASSAATIANPAARAGADVAYNGDEQ